MKNIDEIKHTFSIRTFDNKIKYQEKNTGMKNTIEIYNKEKTKVIYTGYHDDSDIPQEVYYGDIVFVETYNVYGIVERMQDFYGIDIIGCAGKYVRFVNEISFKKIGINLWLDKDISSYNLINKYINHNTQIVYRNGSSENL